MNSVLFVDDDPGILAGLRDALRKYRARWQMTFVASGAAALQELAGRTFDVVVSDMRMPHMDGTALLARVKADYPRTTRIVLSGHADQQEILRSLPSAHQFLSKPCDPAQVGLVIERAFSLNTLLRDEAIRDLVGAIDRLPSVPRIYQALTATLARDEVSVDAVVRLLEQDAAMSVKVLQLVNSAYFGLPQRTTSLSHAVPYLGLDLLKGLVLGTQIFDTLGAGTSREHGLEGLQESSMLVAHLVRRFVGPARADDGFTAGLVHDVGKLVMAVCLGPQHCRVAERVRGGVPWHIAEAEAFGVTHAEVGAYLLGVWGLPLTVVEAVAHHHCPSRVEHEDIELVAAVHVADALVDEKLGRPGSRAADEMLDAAFILREGMAEKLNRWRQIAAAEFQTRQL